MTVSIEDRSLKVVVTVRLFTDSGVDQGSSPQVTLFLSFRLRCIRFLRRIRHIHISCSLYFSDVLWFTEREEDGEGSSRGGTGR